MLSNFGQKSLIVKDAIQNERLSASSSAQFGLNGFHASVLDRPYPPSHQSWMGTLRSKVSKTQQKHTKSGYFGNMLSFTDDLVSFGCVWIRCFGVSSGKPKVGLSRRSLVKTDPRSGVPDTQDVGRCSATLGKIVGCQ